MRTGSHRHQGPMGRNGHVWISPLVAKQGFVVLCTVHAEEDIPLPRL